MYYVDCYFSDSRENEKSYVDNSNKHQKQSPRQVAGKYEERNTMMKKKTTAKRGKKRKHKKSAVINNMMERGNNGKYDGLYNNSKELRTKRKPQDRTPTSPHIAQDRNRCAAAKFLACNNMPLSRNH